MLFFLIILLIVLAATGSLVAVLKVALGVALGLFLGLALVGAAGAWWVRRRLFGPRARWRRIPGSRVEVLERRHQPRD